jgi:hypothetical protein
MIIMNNRSPSKVSVLRPISAGWIEIALDAGSYFNCTVARMKTKFLAALAGVGIIILAAGCVRTVSGTHSTAITWGQDSVYGRYDRTVDQVYSASVQVIQNNGVLITEYVPHDSTNDIRSLYGKVNNMNVWIQVEGIDPQITQVTVQARSKWGTKDLDLIHELEKEIALQLAR